jgi:hypothetical protein
MAFGTARPRYELDPFTDLLFNVLLSVILLFFIVLIFMNPPAKTGIIDPKAEYIVSVSWPDGSADDIDTWVENPSGEVVWFKNPSAGLMHLDRDDRGSTGDTLLVDGREVQNPLNNEVVTLRGVIPGQYVINLHYYDTQSRQPVDAQVSLVKVNPRAEVLFYDTVRLDVVGSERTAVRFTVRPDGSVADVNTLQKSIVRVPTR